MWTWKNDQNNRSCFTRGKLTSPNILKTFNLKHYYYNSLSIFFHQECRDECGSGMQLAIDGKCEPCPRGTYRTQGIQAACLSCPLGRTTPKLGAASIEECSLPICPPGTYLNGTQNSCIACKKGTYQPDSQQTMCLPCPPNMSTKGTSAVSNRQFLRQYLIIIKGK